MQAVTLLKFLVHARARPRFQNDPGRQASTDTGTSITQAVAQKFKLHGLATSKAQVGQPHRVGTTGFAYRPTVRKTREFTALLLFGDDALAVVVEYQNPLARGMNTAHRRTDREQHTRVGHAPHLDMSIVDIKHLV